MPPTRLGQHDRSRTSPYSKRNSCEVGIHKLSGSYNSCNRSIVKLHAHDFNWLDVAYSDLLFRFPSCACTCNVSPLYSSYCTF